MMVQFTGYTDNDKGSLVFQNVLYVGLESDDVWWIRQRVGKFGKSKITKLSLDDYCLDFITAEAD